VAYIGTQPLAGQYRKLDDISSGFNSATTSFTTSVGGTNVTAGSPQQLLVSLGGVIQQPTTDYTVNTSTIIFTTAPASGLSFFAILMGDALNTSVPADGSITSAKLAGSLSVGLAAGSASTPSLFFTGDLNTGIYSPGADQVAITTNGVERVEWGTSEVVFNDGGANYDFRIEGDTNSSLFFVDASAEAVGIGVTDPGSWNANYNGPMAVIGSTSNSACGLVLLTSSTGNSRLDFSQGSGAFGQARGSIVYNHSNDSVAFSTDNTERARIDSSGRLLVGTSSTSRSDRLQVRDANRTLSSGNGNFAVFTSDTQAADVGAKIILGGQSTEADWLYGSISGKSENNSYAGYLAFGTSASNGVHAERIRIDSGGNINIAKTTANLATTGHTFTSNGLAEHVRSGGNALNVNRLASDGALVEFFQDSTLEGSISVSGTTVSYNGAHLSRWSQLPGGTTREEILRGTVLSNIDEMCAWGEEENEQLNRIKVSDVEGDPNVAGVFQAWDDDDGTYTDDFYCAMTGDFIIRIAAGTPVHRGQLLMSAGDGTAIPQDDDIVRSKTVAKVTSHHVTCTYDDGSYCVPCVLMAC